MSRVPVARTVSRRTPANAIAVPGTAMAIRTMKATSRDRIEAPGFLSVPWWRDQRAMGVLLFTPANTFASSGPLTVSTPSAPLLKARKIE